LAFTLVLYVEMADVTVAASAVTFELISFLAVVILDLTSVSSDEISVYKLDLTNNASDNIVVLADPTSDIIFVVAVEIVELTMAS